MKVETQTQQPFEIMDEVVQRGDAQELAKSLGLSPQIIRNWCREPETKSNPHGTGTRGPLDRLVALIDQVYENDGNGRRAYPLGKFIAQRMGGLFTPAPPNVSMNPSNDFFHYMAEVLREMGEATDEVRKVWCEETPGLVSRKEFKAARLQIEESMAAHYLMLLFLEGQMKKVGVNG